MELTLEVPKDSIDLGFLLPYDTMDNYYFGIHHQGIRCTGLPILNIPNCILLG
jgi:hypothetical protein